MVLKSRSVLSGSKQLVRSRSSDNLPTSQSQVNIQMMSHTLTIREVSIAVCISVCLFVSFFLYYKYRCLRSVTFITTERMKIQYLLICQKKNVVFSYSGRILCIKICESLNQ